MRISVVIPVLNQLGFTRDLLHCISMNTVRPFEIILIDNASMEDMQSLVSVFRDLNIIYLKQKENIGVNASWNLGIRSARGDLISFLNNDIVISNFFFDYILDLMDNDLTIGVCVPLTISDKELVLGISKKDVVSVEPLGKREGWAFTIRANIAKECCPIPPNLRTFFGDDFLFDNTRCRGFKIVKMLTNPIFHYGSITLNDMFKTYVSKRFLENERKIWERIKEQSLRK